MTPIVLGDLAGVLWEIQGGALMKFYAFGEKENPAILLLPGTCCHWKNTFGEVIPLLKERFQVICASYDGFDETENTVFPSMLEETERIEEYIQKDYGGNICAAYGCSLGGSFVGLLAARGNIHMDYGILGSSDLDQAGKLVAKIQTSLIMKMMYPLLVHGGFRSPFMRKIYEKIISKMGDYGIKITKMFGLGTGGLPFVQRESVRNQFYSDLVTPLPNHIETEGMEIHILYALKMGKEYRTRYRKHFARPILHEFDLQHEELLACYPKEWTDEVMKICGLHH